MTNDKNLPKTRTHVVGRKPRKSQTVPISLGDITRENLPLPIVHYPSHYGTFIGFAQERDSQQGVICGCARPAVDNLYQLIYSKGAEGEFWSSIYHYFPKTIVPIFSSYGEQSQYANDFVSGICHRCNLVAPSMRYCHEMYGTRFIQTYGWYLNQAYLRLGILPMDLSYLPDKCPKDYQAEIDEVLRAERALLEETERLMEIASGPKRDDISDDEVTYWRNVREEEAVEMINLRRYAARTRRNFTKKIENIVRQEFGFRNVGEGWVSETLLYQIVRNLYTSFDVLFHYRPNWLEGLELDIFVTDAKIGFEYQGAQHFYPVKAWGGVEALEKVRQRDVRKAALCKEHGITLITVDYTEPLTEEYIRSRLPS